MNRNQMIIVFIRLTPLQDRQRSLLKPLTDIWEKCFIGALHDSKLLIVNCFVVLLQFTEYILLRFQTKKL